MDRILERLSRIDRRVLFAVLFAAVAGAILIPFQLPIRPSQLTRKVYERIESLGRRASGPKPPRILLSLDYDPGSKEELHPMAHAVLRHCFRLGIRCVVMTHQPTGVGLVEAVVQEEARRFGKRNGTDYVYLGYRSGDRALIIAMTENFFTAYNRDYYGRELPSLPIMRGIKTLAEFDYLLVITHGETLEWWIVYGQDKAHIPVGGGCTAVVAPDMYPWIQTGQLEGLLGGLAGAAEYEFLTGQEGAATAGMRAQSAAHLLIVLFVLLGNAVFFTRMRRRRSHGGS